MIFIEPKRKCGSPPRNRTLVYTVSLYDSTIKLEDYNSNNKGFHGELIKLINNILSLSSVPQEHVNQRESNPRDVSIFIKLEHRVGIEPTFDL